MIDGGRLRGFEDAWRPPAGRRAKPEAVLAVSHATQVRAKLARLVARTPEVMVKITGRTRSAAHLKAHLEYISRRGALEAEDDRGGLLAREDLRDLANGWADEACLGACRRANSPLAISMVLSMPARTDPLALQDAARAFASEAFGPRFEYAFVLHTDVGHPHVHLAVRARGQGGERLNPKKADLAVWRQAFARALRERGIAAEATPRRARGITRKPERLPVRKLRERTELGRAARPEVLKGAMREAAVSAFSADGAERPWEAALVKRQAKVRGLYLAEARALLASENHEERVLGEALQAWVQAMPRPESRRQTLTRELQRLRNSGREVEEGRAGSGLTKGR